MIVVLNLFDIVKGREGQYAQYLRRVQPILDRYGAKILLYGLTKMIYMGDCTQEFCGLIAYPSLSELRSLSHDPEFTDIRALRDDSTKNYVLTAIEDFESLNDAIALLERRAEKPHTPPPSSST
ncbi:MAG: DUF1330 domain-containing protein [bacterium]|nr:DUF1330 domain-containing protein [bacterium]